MIKNQNILSSNHRHGIPLVMTVILALLLIVLTTACQPEETSTATITETIPSEEPLLPTPTEIPPTEVQPTEPPPEPTETQAPEPTPEPSPTLGPDQPDTTGMVLNVPFPESGAPSASATTIISVRTGPSLDYPVYGLLLENQPAELVGRSQDGEWWAINVPGVPLDQGWVFSAYVETANAADVAAIQPPPVPPELVFAFISGESDSPFVRFRETVYAHSGPGSDYPAYGVIKQGQEARAVYETEDGLWYQIVVQSNLVPTKQAWVPAPFMELRRAGLVSIASAQPVPEASELPAPDSGAPSGVPMTPVYLRSGPDISYPVNGVAPDRNPLEITAVSPNLEWYQVRVPQSVSLDGLAWVSAPFVAASGTDDVPVIEPPAFAAEVATFEPGAGDSWARPLEHILVFAGPGNEYPSPGFVRANQKAVLSGVSREGDWLIVRVPQTAIEGGQGWVRADLVETLLQSSLPVIEPPPK